MIFKLLSKIFDGSSSGCIKPLTAGPPIPPKTVELTPVSSYTVEKIGWLIENGIWTRAYSGWQEKDTGLIYERESGLFVYNYIHSFLTKYERSELSKIWNKKQEELLAREREEREIKYKLTLNSLLSEIENKINERSKSL